MNKPIIIYGKQPAIIYTTLEGETLIHETETHGRIHIAKTLSNILNTPVKELKLHFEGKTGKGTVIYNNGCRQLPFNLGFIQK